MCSSDLTAQIIKSLTDGATLTPEQTAKIKEAIAKSGGGEGRERGSYQAVQDVLTPEQKTAITKKRAVSYTNMIYGSVGLTDDQKKQIDAAADDLAKAGTKPEEFQKKLNDAANGLLTPEQKEKIKGGGVYSIGRAGGAAPGAALGAPQGGNPGAPLQLLNPAPRK